MPWMFLKKIECQIQSIKSYNRATSTKRWKLDDDWINESIRIREWDQHGCNPISFRIGYCLRQVELANKVDVYRKFIAGG